MILSTCLFVNAFKICILKQKKCSCGGVPAWNTTLLFVHVPKTGGTAIESCTGALEHRAPGADSAVHRRVPRCLADDTRSWGLGVHLPEPEALENARRCTAVRGPIVSFAVVRDVDEVARSAWFYLNAHPTWTPGGTPSCHAFQTHRYTEPRPKGTAHRHTFTYAQHTFWARAQFCFHACGMVWLLNLARGAASALTRQRSPAFRAERHQTVSAPTEPPRRGARPHGGRRQIECPRARRHTCATRAVGAPCSSGTDCV